MHWVAERNFLASLCIPGYLGLFSLQQCLLPLDLFFEHPFKAGLLVLEVIADLEGGRQ
jgi:hypothetical protein